MDTECLGGGRIEHFPDQKLLKVYGHSTVSECILHFAFFEFHFNIFVIFNVIQKGYGKADHAESRRVLLTKYADYEIEISDEGY